MKSFWATFWVLLTVHCAFSQREDTQAAGQPLAEVLEGLEKRYDIRFSYADDLIKEKNVSFKPEGEASAVEFLGALERATRIRFELIHDHYVLVRPFVAGDMITICGTMFDEDQQPISELVIRPDSGNTGVITDQRGHFELTVPYGAILTFQHLGFVTKRREAGAYFGTDCAEIFMNARFALLEELVVKDYLSVGITKTRKDVGILPQDLKILPGLIEPDILQSIQQVPGVSSPYETAAGVHVRGGSPDQNLVLWNGIKTYHQSHFFGMLSAFNPYITEDVKFIKNGTSARYGDRVSSVIDIKTSEQVADRFHGGAGFNMIYGDAFVNVPVVKDKLSILASGRRSYTDLMETYTYDQLSKRVFQNTKINAGASGETVNADNNFFFNDLNSNLVFQPGKRDKFLINTLYNKNKLNFSSYNESAGQEFNDLLKTENEGYSLKWMHESGGFSLCADAYYTKYLLKYEFLSLRNDTTELSSKKNLIRDMGFRTHAVLDLADAHQVMIGYELSDNNTQYAFEDRTPLYHLVLDQDNRTVTTHAAFSEYQFESEKTFVSAGARMNYYSGLEKYYVEPRVFIQQALAKPLLVSASAEYRTQVISQIKESVVSDLSLENQVWKLATSERFPIIESYQITTGFTFDRRSWYVDAEAYYKKIDGVTSLTFGFLNPVDNDYRRGNSTIYGVDFFVKKQLDSYKTWLGYSYIHTQNKFFGLNNDEPFPGNWNIEHQVKWSHFYTLGDLQFSLGWTWHTGKAFTEVTEVPGESGPVVVQYEGINAGQLPVYHRLDFSAVYDFPGDKSKRLRYRLGVSVLNLYNRRNLLNREFRTTPSLDNELIDTRIYSLGITPNLVFRVFW